MEERLWDDEDLDAADADGDEGDEGDDAAEGSDDVLLLSTSPFNNSCMALTLSIKPVKT